MKKFLKNITMKFFSLIKKDILLSLINNFDYDSDEIEYF